MSGGKDIKELLKVEKSNVRICIFYLKTRILFVG